MPGATVESNAWSSCRERAVEDARERPPSPPISQELWPLFSGLRRKGLSFRHFQRNPRYYSRLKRTKNPQVGHVLPALL